MTQRPITHYYLSHTGYLKQEGTAREAPGILTERNVNNISVGNRFVFLCKVQCTYYVQGPAVAMVPTKVPLIFCSQWCITKLRSIIPRPFERHCQELHFKIYSHLQVPIFSEISAKNDFYHNAAGQRAAILVSPLVCLRSTTLRMNGSHVITTVAHGTNTLSSRARTDQGGAGRRRAGHRRRAAGQLTFQCARRGWSLS